MKEEFRDIKGYEGHYQISNLGNVKSLERIIHKSNGRKAIIKERILSLTYTKKGYVKVSLNMECVRKGYFIHKLVWNAFRNQKTDGRILHIDHIDDNAHNNKLDNLQVLTARQNAVKAKKRKKSTSEYIGITFSKVTSKWVAFVLPI